ncbi:MAG: CHASE domain-containing protein [Burkholderiales bacterium]|nr:CHASE domain-containing protein [Burkholderiales bacterium]
MTGPTDPAPPPTTLPRTWRDRLVLALVLLVGGGLSLLAGQLLKETEQLRARELRTAATQSVLGAFDLDLTRIVEAVRGAGLMVQSHRTLTREQFNHYAERMLVNLHSVNFVEWQPVVPAAELARFETQARTTGQPHFRVVQPTAQHNGWEPVQGRSEYLPILYCWPERYGTAGYDMSFSPERMESKRKAAMLGQPVASGVFNIMKEGSVASGSWGIAISMPVYNPDRTVGGYVAVVIDLPTLFQEATLRADGAKLDMLVYDLNSAEGKPIYTWLGDESDLTPTLAANRSTTPQDQATTVDFAHQAWEIVLHPRPSFAAGPLVQHSTGVTLAGLLTTVLLLWAVGHVQASRRAMEQAQTRIGELNATLEQRVTERTAQLESAMERLRRSQEELSKSEARATLGTLVAGVSHELSTPMGNSMMTASTLSAQAHDFDKLLAGGQLRRSDLSRFVTQVHEGNELMLRNLERAVELLKNFRQVAADQASEQRRVFNLRQVVQEIVDTLAPSLKHKPHRLLQEIAADIRMDSYPGPLGQVVINLINNAYLHAFDGVAQGTFTIRAQASDSHVTLTFQDDGKGIAPQTLERMFEPFFSTKIGKGGTGLGLSIVENLVTKTLGGQLNVQSTLGVGTTITVTLPLNAPRQA